MELSSTPLDVLGELGEQRLDDDREDDLGGRLAHHDQHAACELAHLPALYLHDLSWGSARECALSLSVCRSHVLMVCFWSISGSMRYAELPAAELG